LLHSNDVGELSLHSEYLHFLIESHWIDTWNPNRLLVVELVLEVLDVVVLQFGGHGADLVQQLIVLLIHNDLFLVDHVVQVKLVHFFEGEWLDAHQVAVLAVTQLNLFLAWPGLFYEVNVLVEQLPQLVFNRQFLLICN